MPSLGRGGGGAVGAHTYKLREQGPWTLALFFCLRISAWCGARGVQFCLLSHSRAWAGQGRFGFWGKLPSEVVSFLAAHSGLDFHAGTLALSPLAEDFLCPMHSWPWDHLTTKLHLVGDPKILSCGSGMPNLGRVLRSQTLVLEGL